MSYIINTQPKSFENTTGLQVQQPNALERVPGKYFDSYSPPIKNKIKKYDGAKVKTEGGRTKTRTRTKTKTRTRNTRKMFGGIKKKVSKKVFLSERQKNDLRQKVNYSFSELDERGTIFDLYEDGDFSDLDAGLQNERVNEIIISDGNLHLHNYLNSVNKSVNSDSRLTTEKSIREQLYEDTIDTIRRAFRGVDDNGKKIKDSTKKLKNLKPIVGEKMAKAIIFEQTHINMPFHNLN